jgi:hypothetical protein
MVSGEVRKDMRDVRFELGYAGFHGIEGFDPAGFFVV